uniref:Oxidation resistance protein 1 n=1 Tax=Pseudictyota dubia TaxID=2749911 RepID=A0A7R9WES6_9STRA
MIIGSKMNRTAASGDTGRVSNGTGKDGLSSDHKEGGCEVKSGLKRAILKRQASLTVGEQVFLRALLIDAPPTVPSAVDERDEERGDQRGGPSHKEMMACAERVLDDDILFSLPFGPSEKDPKDDLERKSSVLPPRPSRHDNSNFIGLWKAHEDGIAPTKLREMRNSSLRENDEEKLNRLRSMASRTSRVSRRSKRQSSRRSEGYESGESFISDEEVRRNRDDDDASSASSWDLSEGGFDHYDAWAVLKDEYADDFGFGFEKANGDEDEDEDSVQGTRHLFKIIGTSADDISAHPHVLSPPLMDSLLNFLPDTLADQNFWLKFSLVRDGASLSILKRYVRAAPNTILAIETTNGDVFGAYTSSAWRSNWGYYGSGEAFLWKMRHSRMTPCHSLFEQAHLESEIDVYFYSALNDYVQLCTEDKIAVGGGELDTSGQEQHGDGPSPYVYLDEGEHYGFGLAISDDLLHGTSSPCATFRNPCLVNHSSKGEVFEIVNLEVWGFTPCENVPDAERLEMTKFFVQESVISSMSSRSSKSRTTSKGLSSAAAPSNSSGLGMWSGSDLRQDEFYRRVGQNDESEFERAGWEYQNMLNPSGRDTQAFMHSPRFS